MPRILKTKDPALFKTREVLVRGKDNALDIQALGTSHDFDSMDALRNAGSNKDLSPDGINNQIYSPNGHTFASLGVSAFPVLILEGQPYTVLVKQTRDDRGFDDTVWKLISGYVDENHIVASDSCPSLTGDPIRSILEEMSEEFLICAKTGNPDDLRFLAGAYKRRPMPEPYGPENYDPDLVYQIAPIIDSDGKQFLPGVIKPEIKLNGSEIEGNPSVYFHAPTNSMQLVYDFHVVMPDILRFVQNVAAAEAHYMEAMSASARHAEDRFKDGQLLVQLHEQDLLFAQLNGSGKLNGTLRGYQDGKFTERDPSEIRLSEAFASKERGIAVKNNIPLKDYLTK